jgi:hypothetical protein
MRGYPVRLYAIPQSTVLHFAGEEKVVCARWRDFELLHQKQMVLQ